MPTDQLSEKDFIHDEYPKNPYLFWIWVTLLTSFLCLLWVGYSWYQNSIFNKIKVSPFLQVTNRQMSLFLWQNPEYMRINAPNKAVYLPGFQYVNKIS